MAQIKRRDFIRKTTLGVGTLYFFPLNGQITETLRNPNTPRLHNSEIIIYDPWLDEN